MSQTLSGVAPTDAERERVSALLREAVGRGVMPLDEFETRLDRVYDAKTLGELDSLVRWLPPRRGWTRRNIVAAALAMTAALCGVVSAGVAVRDARHPSLTSSSAPAPLTAPVTAPPFSTAPPASDAASPPSSVPGAMASAGTVRVEVTYCGAGATAGTVEVKGIANNVWTSPASVKFDISVLSATDGHLVARLGDSDPNLPPQSAHQWDGVGAAATPPPYECRIENLSA